MSKVHIYATASAYARCGTTSYGKRMVHSPLAKKATRKNCVRAWRALSNERLSRAAGKR